MEFVLYKSIIISYHTYHHIANKYIHTCYAQNVKFVTVSFVCASCCFNIHIGSKSYCIWWPYLIQEWFASMELLCLGSFIIDRRFWLIDWLIDILMSADRNWWLAVLHEYGRLHPFCSIHLQWIQETNQVLRCATALLVSSPHFMSRLRLLFFCIIEANNFVALESLQLSTF